jgi:hypothetical protein
MSVQEHFDDFCGLFGRDPACYYLVDWDGQKILDMDQSIGIMMSVYQETHDNDEIVLCCKPEPASGDQVFDTMYCYQLMITNPEVRLPTDVL